MQGAFCPDGDKFIPLPDGEHSSEWQVEFHGPDGLDALYRIQTCPPGFYMNRKDEYPLDDECSQCKAGTYLLDQSNFSDCLTCPLGAVCQGAKVVAESGFWREPDNFTMLGLIQARRTGHSLGVLNKTAQHPTLIPRFAKVHRCPPGSCAKENTCLKNR